MPERDAIRRFVRQALTERLGHTAEPASPQPIAVTMNEALDESNRDVITELDLRDLSQGRSLIVREDAIITPSAKDLIRERGIDVQIRTRRESALRYRLIAVGSDHGGFAMKEQIKVLLSELGHKCRDFGTYSEDPVDYPDIAHAVARAVADRACDLGIIVDGAGIGSAMTANKVPGIRAALCYDEATARNSREHNYANVLSLGGRMLSQDQMRKVVTAWLQTPEGEARHGKRVAKITAIEKQYLR
ncbi:MAG: ribose 5-phosphate isomerase B, partial [Acidobacteriota bacterium]